MKKNIIIVAMSLLIGVAVGLAIIFIIKAASKSEPKPEETESISSASIESIKATLSYEVPIWDGGTYTLKAQATVEPDSTKVMFQLKDGDCILGNTDDGVFLCVPISNTGTYDLLLLNAATDSLLAQATVQGFVEQKTVAKPEEPAIATTPQIQGMTAGEFERLLLSNDNSLIGRHPKVAKRVSISVVGINKGERRPDDIQAVRDKIAFEIWSSAKVVSVSYDSKGLVNSVTIRPVYPAATVNDSIH